MSTDASPVFLTVRGQYLPSTLEGLRVLHNDTAGSQAGIAAPVVMPQSGAKEGEVLFMDWWQDPKGLMDFFANENTQMQGTKLFKGRDATVWMPAKGAFTYSLPAAANRNERFVGLIRGPITSSEKSLSIFRAADVKAQRTARARGLLSHELFIKLNPSEDSAPLELLGVDLWCDAKGMGEHSGDPNEMKALDGAFSGAPTASVWSQAPGNWSEW